MPTRQESTPPSDSSAPPGSTGPSESFASPSRRRLLGWVTGLGTGIVAAACAGLAGGFLSNSVRSGSGTRRVSLARLDELPAEGYLRVAIPLEVQRGWSTATVTSTVYARRDGENTVTAMSGRCTHMGCTVRWSDRDDQFVCPCHEGRFTADGDVVSGPVPRPLDRLATTIEQGQVLVELPEPR